MNLRDAKGKVPISTLDPTNPYTLVPLPDREGFFDLYRAYTSQTTDESIGRYYEIIMLRASGKTLAESGEPFQITKERVRQIEAKFLRLMNKDWRAKTSSTPDLS